MKISVATLGCKVNQFDTAALIEKLREEGNIIVPFGCKVDISIINTCTVTARTDYQSRQLVRRAKKASPEAGIIVTGCYAQVAARELAALPEVTAVIGNAEKEDIPQILSHLTPDRTTIAVGDISGCSRIARWSVKSFPDHTRAFIRVQEGCDAFCTYCIVPFARGPSRSLPPGDVMDQIAALASSGYKEVVISGIHLGAYGSDLNPATSLSELLGLIDGSRMMRRVRLSSIEPLEIEPGLIARIVESTSICRHLHVSLQSGDDTILRSMNRHYSSRYFSELIEVLVKNLPDVAVGLDVMTGFPGEGEREFKNTLSLIDGLPVAYLHVFPYSRRPGTIAAGYSDTVKEDAKKDRVRILRQLSNYKRNLFAKRFIGRKLSVLIETKPDRITGLKKGYTGNYIPVMIDSDDSNLSNRIIDVTCDNVRDGIILGRFKDHG